MDLFRKSKKKQSGLVQSLTDQLDQMAIQESSEHQAEEEEHNNNGSSAAMICHPQNLSLAVVDHNDEAEDTSSAIDALVNSDDEGEAEIFNDSDDDDDDSPPSVHQQDSHHTPSSVRSTLSKGATKAFQDVLASLDGGGGGGSDDDDEDDDDDNEDDNDKSHNSDSAEDYTDDEDEGEEGYKPGGYHPVKVGEVYNQRCVRACVLLFDPWVLLDLGFFNFLSKLLTHSMRPYPF